MTTELSARRLPAAICAVVCCVGLLAVLARSATAQGIGLEELKEMMAWGTSSLVLFDQLEYVPQAEGSPVTLDAVGWYGGAYDRLWFRAEGEKLTSKRGGEVEAQLFYGRLVTPYWDALAGVRVDQRWEGGSATRAHLAVGFTGLAPLRFEFSPTLFLSQHGDLAARLEAEYQVLITQRLAASPEIEVNAALQEVKEWGVGSGLNDVEVGLRLRYEIIREVAPYIGVSWLRRVGGTADFANVEGEAASETFIVVGVRLWR